MISLVIAKHIKPNYLFLGDFSFSGLVGVKRGSNPRQGAVRGTDKHVKTGIRGTYHVKKGEILYVRSTKH